MRSAHAHLDALLPRRRDPSTRYYYCPHHPDGRRRRRIASPAAAASRRRHGRAGGRATRLDSRARSSSATSGWTSSWPTQAGARASSCAPATAREHAPTRRRPSMRAERDRATTLARGGRLTSSTAAESEPASTMSRHRPRDRPAARCVRAFRGRRVAVVGDLLADEFIYGRVERVSREAPVLILRYDHDRSSCPAAPATPPTTSPRSAATWRLAALVGRDDAGRRLLTSAAARRRAARRSSRPAGYARRSRRASSPAASTRPSSRSCASIASDRPTPSDRTRIAASRRAARRGRRRRRRGARLRLRLRAGDAALRRRSCAPPRAGSARCRSCSTRATR